MDKSYVDTVRLMLEVAPDVFAAGHLAMKGGTALNFFVQDLPRLSIDIDATFIPHETPREAALEEIARTLATTRARLARRGIETLVMGGRTGDETKILARRDRISVKVEINHVFRGTLLPVERRRITASAGDRFATDLSVPTLAIAELYGSKLVAALDRQHPRDLFDIHGMFTRFGLLPEFVECLVGYLAGHNRPIHEVLGSRDMDLSAPYENEFAGMAREPVSLRTLEETRTRLRRELATALSSEQKRFLLGLAAGDPPWEAMQCRHLSELPAIKWKLQNLAQLKHTNPAKFRMQSDHLGRLLDNLASRT